jgi:hypothetical protein
VAAWVLNCSNCNQSLARFNIDDDDFENLYLAAKPILLEGGKEYDCPNCGHTATYHPNDASYFHRL